MWSDSDDATLVACVLRAISGGDSREKGFKEAGIHLARSTAACSQRWEAIKENYAEQIHGAEEVAIGSPAIGDPPKSAEPTKSENGYVPFMQESVLNQVRAQRIPVSIFMTNGFRIDGTIVGFDKFSVAIVGKNKQQQLLYKQAISTIIPSKSVPLAKSKWKK